MIHLDSTEREDPSLQADPVLILSDGYATFGQKLFGAVAALVIVLGTVYGLVHQRGEIPRSTAIFAVDGAVLPDTVRQAK